ncbi:Fe-Mn family superoxide dismutase [Halomonas urumqiensis]|uniref:Superoxide dismutase n=1 Tax=Halomonas urumqiensis TaxID=1684789 RepID=A0A2N7UEX4_9GAMM|nr:Fe-Mn family superoxide dismutase [Halomonas urumqiensis]PMR78931.1 superoxide dismutase [Fe] [Halomonas urumqiensis]PTB04164.1 superoxide dismutase [Fe] [Halomonas urumqiensis]GHE19567.1 superoxide dismutase [Halomonas urumqiensis]
MAFELPALPYDKNALEPYIAAETLEYRYYKQHQACVTRLNELIDVTGDAQRSLQEIISTSSGDTFDQAVQVWNHTFHWHCLSPYGDGRPKGALSAAIETRFGSFEGFKQRFTDAAMANLGTGWTWLIKTAEESVEIVNTSATDTPIAHGQCPVLVVDVCEDAKYLDNVWQLLNWDFAALNFTSALSLQRPL